VPRRNTSVTTHTEPDNAAVFVDGKALGVSPLHVASEPRWLPIVLTPVD